MLTCLMVLPISIPAQPLVDVVLPTAGQHLRASESHFIYGRVSPAHTKLSINGQEAAVYRNGAFIAYLPVTPGPFVFRMTMHANGESAETTLPVFVESLPILPSDRPDIDLTSLRPLEKLVLSPGDELTVSLRATANCQVTFSVAGTGKWFAMPAQTAASETYSGAIVFVAPVGETGLDNQGTAALAVGQEGFAGREIIVQVKNQLGEIAHHAFGDLTVETHQRPQFGRVLPETGRVDMEPEGESPLFLQHGTRLRLAGRRGDFWRVELTASLRGWIHHNDFYWLPEDASVGQTKVGPIELSKGKNTTRISVPMSDRLPFRLVQNRDPGKLQVTIWGETNLQNDADLPRSLGLIKKMAWNRSKPASVLSVDLNVRQQWGYTTQFIGDTLILDLRHPPPSGGQSPLADRLILLDPGHHPDEGAIGPTRLEERVVNWAIVAKLKALLEERGAFVILSRTDRQGASIQARTQIAALTRPDVLISVHNNALPEGFDPGRNRGTSTFYYHRHSQRLAETIQRNLARDLKLRDHGVRKADLAVCRLTGMPAVLVECAFMMLPQQEALLGTEKFQLRIARSLLRSLEQYFRKYAV